MCRAGVRIGWPRIAAAIVGSSLIALHSQVLAAGLQVTPISLEIGPQQQAQMLILSNTANRPMRAQVRIQRWRQQHGEEQLTATRELAASPPLVELPAGGRQTVRIVKLELEPVADESAFRLIIDELPPSPEQTAADEGRRDAAEGGGLQFLLRYSIPVFVSSAAPELPETGNALRPSAPAPPSPLTARIVGPDDRGSLIVEIANPAPRRAKLSQVAFLTPQGQRKDVVPGLLGYVLAGERMRWSLEMPFAVAQAGGTLRARIDDDPTEQSLRLAIDRP